MRGRNHESSPRIAAWFALCAMTVALGFALNTVGACGPPATSETVEETTADAGEVTPKPDEPAVAEKPAEIAPEKPQVSEEPAITPEEPAVAEKPVEGPPPETPTDSPSTKGDGKITSATAASSNVPAPLDASPGPDGKVIYYTAYKKAADITQTQSQRSQDADVAKNADPFGQNTDRQEGALFKVDASGGTPQELVGGFWSPTGLVVSKDGSKIYVADSSVSDTLNPDEVGAIYVVDSAGGTKTVINGTKGYKPKSLDIVMEATEQLYFTGIDPTSGKPGVFRVPVGGGTVTTVYTPGANDTFFSDPGGIAVTADRTIYVAETVGGMGGNASAVIQIKGGNATEFATGIKVGYPAGIALSQDEKFILVSGIERDKRTAVLYRIDLSDPKKIEQISKGIDDKTNSAGLHRAHNADIYAWADAAFPDLDGKGGGTVFLLRAN